MNKILYEIRFVFEPYWLFFILFLVVAALLPRSIKKACEDRGLKADMRIVKIVCAVAFAELLLIFSAIGIGDWCFYRKVAGAYENGDYEIVEGYVDNYQPYPLEGRSGESFEIDGVVFSYSDHSVQPGYHNAAAHQGIITGDGQHLKIGYIPYNRNYGNIIVYIEEIADE